MATSRKTGTNLATAGVCAGRYTTKIIKAGALLADTKTLLAHWDLDSPVQDNLQRIQHENIFGKASRSRVEDILRYALEGHRRRMGLVQRHQRAVLGPGKQHREHLLLGIGPIHRPPVHRMQDRHLLHTSQLQKHVAAYHGSPRAELRKHRVIGPGEVAGHECPRTRPVQLRDRLAGKQPVASVNNRTRQFVGGRIGGRGRFRSVCNDIIAHALKYSTRGAVRVQSRRRKQTDC